MLIYLSFVQSTGGQLFSTITYKFHHCFKECKEARGIWLLNQRIYPTPVDEREVVSRVFC